MEYCARFIFEILKVYTKGKFENENLIHYPLENEYLETYAEGLKQLIEKEKKKNPEKILLDMTPGRKYMSATNIYYGLNEEQIPIQILYLHRQNFIYQNVPYPLTPINTIELIDMIDSANIFTQDIEKIQTQKEPVKKDFKLDISPEFIKKLDEMEVAKSFLVLVAIYEGFNSKIKIRKYLFSNKINIQGNELEKILSKYRNQNFIKPYEIAPNRVQYKISEDGIDSLINLYDSFR